MWFFFLPSFVAILVIGFIQVRDELSRHPETEATTDSEETAVPVPIEVERGFQVASIGGGEVIEGGLRN